MSKEWIADHPWLYGVINGLLVGFYGCIIVGALSGLLFWDSGAMFVGTRIGFALGGTLGVIGGVIYGYRQRQIVG